MNFRNFGDMALLSLAKTIEDALVNRRIQTFDDPLADELAAALSALNTSFETAIHKVGIADNAKQAAVAAKGAHRAMQINLISTILRTLGARGASAADYEITGFTPPKRSYSRVVAQDPSDLAAEGFSNNVNRLAFRGNNPPGRITYQIWRRDGRGGEWRLIGTTGTQRYIDDPVTPGQRCEYKIRAQAARTVSNFSNMAVVYGTP